MKRSLVIAGLLVAVPLVASTRREASAAAPPSSAFHLRLKKAEPGINDTIAVSPQAVKLWFTEPVEPVLTSVRIIGPGGHVISVGDVAVNKAPQSPAVAAIKQTLAPGTYNVDWKTMSDDGHPQNGTFAFTLRAAH